MAVRYYTDDCTYRLPQKRLTAAWLDRVALLDQVVRQGDFIGVSALYLRDGKQLAYAQAGRRQ